MWRWMFSTTMMASSTTRPMASTMASSVSRLIEKPERQHDERRPDQGQRHGDRRNEHKPKRAEKEEDHHHHNSQRFSQRVHHLVDRIMDVGRGSHTEWTHPSPAGNWALMSGNSW